MGQDFRDGLRTGERSPSPSRRTAIFKKDDNARARPGRASLYDEITGNIIARLEAGRVPWVQPWGSASTKAPLAMPANAAKGGGIPASMF